MWAGIANGFARTVGLFGSLAPTKIGAGVALLAPILITDLAIKITALAISRATL